VKLAVLAAAALALAVPPQAPVLRQRDFNQIIQLAVTDAAASWTSPSARTICVQRELERPFNAVKHWIDDFHQARTDLAIGTTDFRFTRNPAIDQWIPAAMGPGADIAPETVISSLSMPYLLFSRNKPTPPECAVSHLAGRTSAAKPMAVTLTFTRPVLAGGYVFVDEVQDCPGLCGNGILNVFQKQHGRWTRVAQQVLWVS
jgi:hypothetical protein